MSEKADAHRDPQTCQNQPGNDTTDEDNLRIAAHHGRPTGYQFCERKGARYLAFPKSLQKFAGQRVVGINWELVKS